MAHAIYFVGDVHLGRRPVTGALAEIASAQGLDPDDLGPRAALGTLVERAVAERARAVVFAGDLVDDTADRFSAFGPLSKAVGDLSGAGIEVIAVAGNHDVEALPRLARRVPDLRLLGRDGRWEIHPLGGEGPPVDLLGWSFPDEHFNQDPTAAPGLREALDARRPEATLLGVLHCDLGAATSRYAPISRDALRRLGTDAFFLGHIHQPDALPERLEAGKVLGMLGSLTALDRGEQGRRGAWRLSFPPGGGTRLEHLALAPLRHERIALDLDDESGRSAEVLLNAATDEVRRRLAGEDELGLRLVAVRLELRGRLSDRRAVHELCGLSPDERLLDSGRAQVVLAEVVDATRPAIPLRDLTGDRSLLGHLARRIQALEDGDGAAAPLLERARRAISDLERQAGWTRSDGMSDANLRAHLLDAAWRTLEALYAQRTGDGKGP